GAESRELQKVGGKGCLPVVVVIDIGPSVRIGHERVIEKDDLRPRLAGHSVRIGQMRAITEAEGDIRSRLHGIDPMKEAVGGIDDDDTTPPPDERRGDIAKDVALAAHLAVNEGAILRGDHKNGESWSHCLLENQKTRKLVRLPKKENAA